MHCVCSVVPAVQQVVGLYHRLAVADRPNHHHAVEHLVRVAPQVHSPRVPNLRDLTTVQDGTHYITCCFQPDKLETDPVHHFHVSKLEYTAHQRDQPAKGEKDKEDSSHWFPTALVEPIIQYHQGTHYAQRDHHRDEDVQVSVIVEVSVVYHRHHRTGDQDDYADVVYLGPNLALLLRVLLEKMEYTTDHETRGATDQKGTDEEIVLECGRGENVHPQFVQKEED